MACASWVDSRTQRSWSQSPRDKRRAGTFIPSSHGFRCLERMQMLSETKHSPACLYSNGFRQRKVPQSKPKAPQRGWKSVTLKDSERRQRKPKQRDQLSRCAEKHQDKGKGQEAEEPSKNNCITSNPCSLPTFIMSLQRFGTMHMTSTAFCGWGESRVKGQALLSPPSNFSFSLEGTEIPCP